MSIVERALDKARAEKKTPDASLAVPPIPESRDHRVTSPVAPANYHAQEPVAALAAASEIVRVDLARLRSIGRLPQETSARQAREELRRIKWPLLSAIRRDNAGEAPVRNNIIQVTSALPGEGKTYTALMLALSVVQDREQRVLLIDGDVARPGLTPALEMEDKPGLLDALDNRDLDIAQVTYRTNVDGLFVVPAGTWHDQASELLAGSRMPQIIGNLLARLGNGVVILDSPPILATNEAQVLTKHVGQVLFVVRADDTEQRAIRDAIALIDHGAKTSAVLNNVRASRLGRYYGDYGYGYGYGDGYGYRRRNPESGAKPADEAP